MLRNPMDPNEVRNRRQFPKNNSFCHRWRVVDNFSKSSDREQFHLRVQGADNHHGLMSDKFLELYKSRYTSSSNELIVDLAQDAVKFLNRQKQEHYELSKLEVTLSTAVRQLMERCFKTLLSFSTDLNTVLGKSGLFVTASEPEIKKRSNSIDKSVVQYVQAHLSTSVYRLVIEGRQDQICFYLIPADNIIAMYDLAREYEPVTAWKAQFALQNHVHWLSPAGVLTEDLVDVACAELLRHLIEQTKKAIAPNLVAQVQQNYGSFDIMESDPWVSAPIMIETVKSSSFVYGETAVSGSSAHNYGSSGVSGTDPWSSTERALSDCDVVLQKESSTTLKGVNQLWKTLDQSSPKMVSSNCNSQIGERSSTSAARREEPREPSMNPPVENGENKTFTRSSVGTRTDSVPSLSSLLKESGVYTTNAADADVRPVRLPTYEPVRSRLKEPGAAITTTGADADVRPMQLPTYEPVPSSLKEPGAFTTAGAHANLRPVPQPTYAPVPSQFGAFTTPGALADRRPVLLPTYEPVPFISGAARYDTKPLRLDLKSACLDEAAPKGKRKKKLSRAARKLENKKRLKK